MKWQKGQSGNPKGKPIGAKNKLRANLVEEIRDVLDELAAKGKGLKECANEDPKWFMEQFVKPLIPKNVDVNLDGKLEITWQQ